MRKKRKKKRYSQEDACLVVDEAEVIVLDRVITLSESTYIGPLRERRGPPMGPTSASTSAPISVRGFAIQRD